LNSKNIILILLSVFCNLSYSQWVTQPVPSNTSIFLSIDFLDNTKGISGGWYYGDNAYGRIAYTTNSGINWYSSQIPDTIRSVVQVQFINSQLAYAVGAYNKYHKIIYTPDSKILIKKNIPLYYSVLMKKHISDTSTRGVFLKSTDNGKTWLASLNNFADTIYYFEGMQFLDANTGYISGDLADVYNNQHSVIIKTTNGGLNWIKLVMPDSLAYLRNIYFINSVTGFAVGYYSVSNPVFGIQGAIIKTTDGGLNWIQNKFYFVNNFTSLVFVNSTTGFACGVSNSLSVFSGVIYKTTNAGQDWIKLNYQLDTTIFEGINFLNNTGRGFVYGEKFGNDTAFPGTYVLKNRAIARTTDFGNSWFTQLFPDADNIYIGSCVIDKNNWYISGGQFAAPALILHTTNGGGPIGIESISDIVPEGLMLYPNYPNPFNPVTAIKFDLPNNKYYSKSGNEFEKVEITIYDILGNKIATLVNTHLKPGQYKLSWNASDCSSGIYFLNLKNRGFSLTQKLILYK
jgi:hypothetical protein